jgi:hypothetical protein
MGALAQHRFCEEASGMKKKTTLPKFVALFDETIDAPAWRALTPSARALYVALKRKLNYEKNNNGKIYLAHRSAARELGSNKDCIARWYRELQFYGFIIMTEYGGLGINGKGRAAKWRLTEWEYDDKPATWDFLKWDGKKFKDGRRQYRQLRQHRKNKSLSANSGHPVRKFRTKETAKVSANSGQRACPQIPDITIGYPSDPSLRASLNDRRPRTSRPTENACGWGVGQPSDPGPCRSRSREAHPHREHRKKRARARASSSFVNRTIKYNGGHHGKDE